MFNAIPKLEQGLKYIFVFVCIILGVFIFGGLFIGACSNGFRL